MRAEHLIKRHLIKLRFGDETNFRISLSPTYHAPTVPIDYNELRPSNGNRVPAVKSPFNYRGVQPNHADGRVMWFESNLELNAGKILQADRNIVELREQWPTVSYRGSNGELVKHTFDYWARARDGKRVAIAVKPVMRLLQNDLIGELSRIKDQGIAEFADDISFITEAFASDDAAYNADQILLARRVRNEDEYQVARSMLERIHGPVRFAELLKDAAPRAHRRTALWCLIDEGILHPAAPGRIEDNTIMLVNI